MADLGDERAFLKAPPGVVVATRCPAERNFNFALLTPRSDRTGDFFRLFLVPGMGHCSGGDGPNTFDTLSALEQWVEHGKAPEQMIASKTSNGVTSRYASSVSLSTDCEMEGQRQHRPCRQLRVRDCSPSQVKRPPLFHTRRPAALSVAPNTMAWRLSTATSGFSNVPLQPRHFS